MMDYLLARGEIENEKITELLKKYSNNLEVSVQFIKLGTWSLFYSSGFYSGFEPYQNDDYFVLVLGAPLIRGDEKNLRSFKESELTRLTLSTIFSRRGKGLDCFIGGFQILVFDKKTDSILIFNDKVGFVPIYCHQSKDSTSGSDKLILSSHVDILAQSLEKSPSVDTVSVADFLAFQTVTFPFTFYDGIFQLDPSRPKIINATGVGFSEEWVANDQSPERFDTIRQSSESLYNAVKEAEDQVLAYSGGKLGLLFSGGEDSRALLCSADDPKIFKAYTVCDSHNFEAKIANTVCDKVGCSWSLIQRPPSHYLDNIHKSVRISESHNFFYHAHFNGFSVFNNKNSIFMGGLSADAFCKGSHVKKFSRFGIVRGFDKDFWQYRGTKNLLDLGPFKTHVVARRKNRNSEVKAEFSESWQEFHSLYPATMNTNGTNYFVNRRLFRSFEPFADASIFDWSMRTPIEWKLNRRVFHLAFKRSFSKSWSIPNSKKTFPYFGYWLNGPLSWLISIFDEKIKGLKRRLRFKIKNEGPWPVWKNVVNSEAFSNLRMQIHGSALQSLLGQELFDLLEKSLDSNDPVQALAGLHVKVWAEGFLEGKPDADKSLG